MNDAADCNEPAFLTEKIGQTTLIRFNHNTFDRVEIQDLREALRQVVTQTEPPNFVIDFAHVSYMSSIILGVIMGIHLNICNREGCLRICGMNPITERVFHITRLDKVLRILPTYKEALAELA